MFLFGGILFQCYTMPQYLRLRFGGQRIRTWLALISTLVTIISSLAVSTYMYFGLNSKQVLGAITEDVSCR